MHARVVVAEDLKGDLEKVMWGEGVGALGRWGRFECGLAGGWEGACSWPGVY